MAGETTAVGAGAALAAQTAAFLALLLVASAVHKALGWRRSRAVLSEFAAVPAALTGLSLIAIVAGEALAGVFLVIPTRRQPGAEMAVAIWLLYLGLIVRAIRKNRSDVDCGCSFGDGGRPLGWYQITRNSTLAALSVFVATAAVSGRDIPVEGVQMLGALALLALYGALDQVMALQPLRRAEVS